MNLFKLITRIKPKYHLTKEYEIYLENRRKNPTRKRKATFVLPVKPARRFSMAEYMKTCEVSKQRNKFST